MLAATQDSHDERTAAPSRDRQRREALDRANAVRSARATLRRALQDGGRRAADVVADPPPDARSMPVGEVLAAQHRWGASRVGRVLRQVPVPETKPVGLLTVRQRLVLVGLLGGSVAESGDAGGDDDGAVRRGTTGRRCGVGTPGAAG